MKRESKFYDKQEITYTFTHVEVVEALCKIHQIPLPRIQTAVEWWKVYGLKDEDIAIRIGYEGLRDEKPQPNEQARAWEKVFEELRKHNPAFSNTPISGEACAVAEIRRLQALDKGSCSLPTPGEHK